MKSLSQMSDKEVSGLFDTLEDIPPLGRYRLKARREELGLPRTRWRKLRRSSSASINVWNPGRQS